MKATLQCGRKGSANHNEHGHIPEAERDVELCDATRSSASTLRERELAVYREELLEGIEERNARYLKQRHAERMRTLEQIYIGRITRPEECILQVGNIYAAIDRAFLVKLVTEFCRRLQNWIRTHGYPFRLLDVAYHFDKATPHAHLRRVWKYTDRRGYVRIGQDKALEKAGVELPYPDKNKGRYNNRKMTFDAMAREMWYEVCREHGLDIDTKPLPARRHMSVREYTAEQIRAKEARVEALTEASEALENEVTRKQGLAREAERRAAEARAEATVAKEEASCAHQRMIVSQEEAARCRREARLAYEELCGIRTEIKDAGSILMKYRAQLDREGKSDLTGIMSGIAARQGLDAIRKEHPELFDEKGRYRKKAGRSRRGERINDMLRPCRHCISL